MTGFLIAVVITAISLLIISKLPIGVEVDNPLVALLGGGIIGVFNGLWSLFPAWFRATSAVISLGIIPLVGSIIVFGLAAWLLEGFRLKWGLGSALLGAIALSLINSFLFFMLRQFGLATV